jgi:GNAT superfamily N-acetyltransferase
VNIAVVAYDHPDAAGLIAGLQQEYQVRYGGPDGTPVTPAEFAPPRGLFLVGYRDGVPVACGGWRSRAPDAAPDGTAASDAALETGADAEMKRMYVTKDARRAGLAGALLVELEATAQAAGHRRMILETGTEQPEAVAFYRSAGYTPIAAFGHYVRSPRSIHLGKLLGDLTADPPGGYPALPEKVRLVQDP